ncbi:MAG: hypothetical protein HGA45_25835 [Chloroflexales bacterium]|nr:hypothetical protein [Chloroflexales bacterium]
MSNGDALRGRLLDPRQFVTLYGTTPPRADAPPERVESAAAKLAERVAPLGLDGLVVYDVQDEHDRTDIPRPFPFLPTLEPRTYAHRLQCLTGIQALTYKVVVNFSETSWLAWLNETRADYGISYLSLVGSSTPNPAPDALPVDRALQLAATQVGGPTLGGVVIAERHSAAYDESRRLLQKAERGCRYFISQVVYDTAPTIGLLSDYVAACAAEGVEPRRIILTFSPCGRAKTMEFIKWLGITISPATEEAILGDPAPFSRSIQFCREMLREILDQGFAERLPLGVNIESVSIHKDEIEASIELVHALREVAREYGLPA